MNRDAANYTRACRGMGIAAILLAAMAVTTATAAPLEPSSTVAQSLSIDAFLASRSATSVANVFPAIPTPARAGMSVDTVARRYERDYLSNGKRDGLSRSSPRRADDLLIFVSLSMPATSLRHLIRQASKVGGTVVLRGFKNDSLKETALAIHALGEAAGNVTVDPNAFATYGVDAVPTFVLLRAGARESGFVSISGDVSLDYALSEIARQTRNASCISGSTSSSPPAFAEIARRYAEKLGSAS